MGILWRYLLATFLVCLVSYNAFAVKQTPAEFLKTLENISTKIEKSDAISLNKIYDMLFSFGPENIVLDQDVETLEKIIKISWNIRLKISKNNALIFKQFGKNKISMIDASRKMNRALRYIEDMAGEILLQKTDSTFKYFDKKTDPNSYRTLNNSSPWLLKNNGKVGIRSGDIFISRGNAYSSAAISRMGEEKGQFSHLAIVYIEGEEVGKTFSIEEIRKMDNAKIIEAHISEGNLVRTFREYLDDGNARVVHIRIKSDYGDAKLAHLAAKHSYNVVNDYLNETGQNLPYDFSMLVNNSEELFCSEVVYVGYKKMGIELPLYMTTINQQHSLIQKLGIKVSKLFAPADMEVDPRFQIKAEWRDYRKMRNIRYKDAVLNKLIEWMGRENYSFSPSLTEYLKAKLVKIVRGYGVGKKYISTNIPEDALATMLVLDVMGAYLQEGLEKADNLFVNDNGIRMSAKEMYGYLEEVFLKDYLQWKNGKQSMLHGYLRPKGGKLIKKKNIESYHKRLKNSFKVNNCNILGTLFKF